MELFSRGRWRLVSAQLVDCCVYGKDNVEHINGNITLVFDYRAHPVVHLVLLRAPWYKFRVALGRINLLRPSKEWGLIDEDVYLTLGFKNQSALPWVMSLSLGEDKTFLVLVQHLSQELSEEDEINTGHICFNTTIW